MILYKIRHYNIKQQTGTRTQGVAASSWVFSTLCSHLFKGILDTWGKNILKGITDRVTDTSTDSRSMLSIPDTEDSWENHKETEDPGSTATTHHACVQQQEALSGYVQEGPRGTTPGPQTSLMSSVYSEYYTGIRTRDLKSPQTLGREITGL